MLIESIFAVAAAQIRRIYLRNFKSKAQVVRFTSKVECFNGSSSYFTSQFCKHSRFTRITKFLLLCCSGAMVVNILKMFMIVDG